MTLNRLMLALVLCTLTGVLWAPAYARQTPWNVIHSGVESRVPPFESRNVQGERVGRNIESGNALCTEPKVRCEWVEQDSATNLAALDAGRFDAIIQGYPVAASDAQSTERSPLRFSPAAPGFPVSRTVRAGSFLYLSGLLGLDENRKRVPGGVEAETARALENMQMILRENGLSMERVVKCTVILADIKEFAAMNKVYARYFSIDHPPARTTFAAAGLALDARVEIECLASY